MAFHPEHDKDDGYLATMFRVPATDKTFIPKLKKYSTKRIKRVRRYGQAPKNPGARSPFGYVPVSEATWFSVMLDDAVEDKHFEDMRQLSRRLATERTTSGQLEAELNLAHNRLAEAITEHQREIADLVCTNEDHRRNERRVTAGLALVIAIAAAWVITNDILPLFM